MYELQIIWNSFRQNNSDWAHMGVKAFKFERARHWLALDFNGQFFWYTLHLCNQWDYKNLLSTVCEANLNLILVFIKLNARTSSLI